jgi:hypothetical protein
MANHTMGQLYLKREETSACKENREFIIRGGGSMLPPKLLEFHRACCSHVSAGQRAVAVAFPLMIILSISLCALIFPVFRDGVWKCL